MAKKVKGGVTKWVRTTQRAWRATKEEIKNRKQGGKGRPGKPGYVAPAQIEELL